MLAHVKSHRRPRFLAALLLMPGLLVTVPSAASATDTGGDGNPSACSDGYTVASAPLVGVRGPTAGQVELRWSSACYANWTRVVLYGGLYSNAVNIEEVIDAEGRYALADDTVTFGSGGTTAWTPFLRLANCQSRACAHAWVSSDFGTLNYHTVAASVCA